MLKQGEVSFELGLKQRCDQKTVYEDDKKANIMTTRQVIARLKIKDILRMSIAMFAYWHQ